MPEVGKYFDRPLFTECITLNAPGKMACNGEVKDIPARLIIPHDMNEVDNAKRYFGDKEFRLYVCLKSPRRCK